MTTDDPLSGPPGGDESDRATPSMGTLVIRTWNEPDQAPGFRARLTFSQVPTADPATVYAVDPEEVLRLVRQWVLSQAEPPREV
jgi:hypothetical protein